jgi:mRNA-degrading endonuclease YafQ of YafQ-DinJ toxin-antitoxin module
MMVFEEIAPFQKDFKGLLKKYKTLSEDLQVVRKVMEILPDARPPFSFRIDNLGIESCVIKVKKIACKSLKGKGVNSGLRLIYAYFEAENRIVFIEIYHKNDKENEDRERILSHFS